MKGSHGDPGRWVDPALHGLSLLPQPLAEAEKHVPRSAGLYALSAPARDVIRKIRAANDAQVQQLQPIGRTPPISLA